MNQVLGLDVLPAGQMAKVAIMTYLGFNQEDAFIFKRSSLELGLFTYIKYSTYKVIVKSSADIKEELGRPTPRPGEPADRFANLDERGIIKPGSYAKAGDILVGKIRTNVKTGVVEPASERVSIGEEGRVDRVLISTNSDNRIVVKIRLMTQRMPVVGDKLASRFSQKGTIGLILDDDKMPVSMIDGTSPDIIINPHSIPSRMTINRLSKSWRVKYQHYLVNELMLPPFVL